MCVCVVVDPWLPHCYSSGVVVGVVVDRSLLTISTVDPIKKEKKEKELTLHKCRVGYWLT